MSERRTYPVLININDRTILKVIIDSHYEIKHKESIDDITILKLVQTLDGKTFVPEVEKDGFMYFKTEPLLLNKKNYRLIWLLENDELYIGVINAFRR